jgi:predicted amidohydrolase YtcJ
MEGKKGQVMPGQFADLVVLSADVTKISPPQILKTEVLRGQIGAG